MIAHHAMIPVMHDFPSYLPEAAPLAEWMREASCACRGKMYMIGFVHKDGRVGQNDSGEQMSLVGRRSL